jgi:hypothetical protein
VIANYPNDASLDPPSSAEKEIQQICDATDGRSQFYAYGMKSSYFLYLIEGNKFF